MKNLLFNSILILFLFTGLTFLGCFKDDSSSSSSGVDPAEAVTIEQLKNDFPVAPTGTGSIPADKAQTTQALDDIDSIEGDVEDLVVDEINRTKTNLKKSLKRTSSLKYVMLKKARASRASDSDSDSDSWDEEGTIDLAILAGFDSGTVDYDTAGSYSDSWSYSDDISTGLTNWTDQGNYQDNSKGKFNDVKPSGVDVTLNGYANENYKENYNDSGTYYTATYLNKTMALNQSIYISYRSGYSISGSIYTGYIVISMDFSFSINRSFTEAELQTVNIGDYYSKSGNMTITVYNAAGVMVHSETYTAEEIWNLE